MAEVAVDICGPVQCRNFELAFVLLRDGCFIDARIRCVPFVLKLLKWVGRLSKLAKWHQLMAVTVSPQKGFFLQM